MPTEGRAAPRGRVSRRPRSCVRGDEPASAHRSSEKGASEKEMNRFAPLGSRATENRQALNRSEAGIGPPMA